MDSLNPKQSSNTYCFNTDKGIYSSISNNTVASNITLYYSNLLNPRTASYCNILQPTSDYIKYTISILNVESNEIVASNF